MKNYLLLITLFSYQIISGQNSYNFIRISLSEGLSQSTVTSIFQDKNGFLWFGTVNGLNKYDGYNFTIYKHNPFDDKTISNDYINAINEDNKGNLWIGTANGLNKFNPLNEIFIQYRIEPDDNSGMGLNSIIDIVIDEKDNLWLATYNSGLYYFDHLKSDYKKIINNSAAIRSLFKDSKGNIWIGTTRRGVFRFCPAENSYTNISADPSVAISLSDNEVLSIFEDVQVRAAI